MLLDEHLHTIAEATGPSCYYFGGDIDLVARVLAEGIEAIEQSSGIRRADIDRAFFALPAFGEVSADVPTLERIAGAVLGHARYSCGNDMIAGWAGSLHGRDGVNVVAGTGSIAYGEWRGRGSRVGGWGEVFGDEGSGYWTAIRGLNAFSRMSDGRLPRGPLHDRMRRAVGVLSDTDVIGVVLDEWAGRRNRVAALSKVVVAAADDGDGAAQRILVEAGGELAALVHAARAALDVPASETLLVSYSGGMFAAPTILATFADRLGAGCDLVEPAHGPAIGAALVAMKQAGAAIPAV